MNPPSLVIIDSPTSCRIYYETNEDLTLLVLHVAMGWRGLSLFILAAVTEIAQTGWLINNTYLFLSVLNSGKYKIRAHVVSSKGLCFPCVLTRWGIYQGSLWGLFYKALTLSIHESTILTIEVVPKDLAGYYHHPWALGFQCTNLGGGRLKHSDLSGL